MKKTILILVIIISYSSFGGGSKHICPAELTDFDVKFTAEGVLVKWETSSEYQTSKFWIMRALFEVPVKHEFEIVDSLDAAGNSTTKKNYEYIDADYKAGASYFYKLRIIDKDGDYSESDEKLIELPLVHFAEDYTFDAVLTENKVKISWGTDYEAGIESYFVMKQVEGGAPETIITAPARGDSTGVVYYGDFFDEDIQPGHTYFYTLFIKKYNTKTFQIGSSIVSYTSPVNVNPVTESRQSRVIPNPFSGSTLLEYSTESAGNAAIEIYNSFGMIVFKEPAVFKPAGRHQYHFNGEKLPQGCYYYFIKTESSLLRGRMQIVK